MEDLERRQHHPFDGSRTNTSQRAEFGSRLHTADRNNAGRTIDEEFNSLFNTVSSIECVGGAGV